jgi:hypothetical protein
MTESRGSGAASRRTDAWDQIDWRQAERTVRCLLARIVKATQRRVTPPYRRRGCGGLSRMRGNSHVRFSGEGAAERPPPYPTYSNQSKKVIGRPRQLVPGVRINTGPRQSFVILGRWLRRRRRRQLFLSGEGSVISRFSVPRI